MPITVATSTEVETPDATSKVEPSASESTDETETEVLEEESDPQEETEEEETEETEEETEEDEKPKKKRAGKMQKRFRKLAKQKAELRDENAYLRTQLYERDQGTAKPDRADTTKADGPKKPVMDDYEDYSDYIEDLTDYKVEKAQAKNVAKAKETKAQTEFKDQLNDFKTKSKEFSDSVDDFEDVITDVDDIKATSDLQMALLDADNGPRLMYELAKNPDEYRRVNQLSRSGIDRALGRLEGKMELSSKPKNKVEKSRAPKPLGKVGTKGKGVAKSIYDTDLSQREYERLRTEQRKQKAY